MIAVYISVLALFVALSLVPLLARWSQALGLVDQPGPRKIHDHAIPRIGGIAIAGGALLSVLVWLPLNREVGGYLAGALMIVLFGIADDRHDLHYRLKFAAQIGAALLFVLVSGVQLTRAPFVFETSLPGWLGLPLTVIVLVGITNAVNLSDGMDGLAGGTSLIAAGFFGYLAYLGDDRLVALIALALIGAIFGFLRYNTFPARVFMGDSGSQFLGFSVAVLGIVVIERSNTAISPLVPVLVLGLPILDTLYVMVRRIRSGNSPFMPDRQHLHHRLLDAGLSQYEALLVIYGLQVLLLVLAWLLQYAHDLFLFLAFAAFSGALLFVLGWWESRPTHAREMARRLDLVDPLVEYLKARDVLRRVGNNGAVYGIALLFLVAPWWTDGVTPDIGWFSLLLGVLMLLAMLAPKRLPQIQVDRLAAFAVAVVIVYLVETRALQGYLVIEWLRAYLVVIAVCVAMWLRFGGAGDFHLNTLDVLVILVVAIVPQMPLVRELDIGLMLIEVLFLFYACELILGEEPGHWPIFRWSVLAALVAFSVRGIFLGA